MDLELKDKVAVITGGSAGIGFATAQLLAQEGAKITICARRRDQLDDAAKKLSQETGGEVLAVEADITSPDAIGRFAATVKDRFGQVDILVNNAGTGIYKSFFDVTDEDLVTGMQMNFFAMFRVTRSILPLMLENGGTIVNIAGTSGASVLDEPFFSTCTGPAKAAEIRFTKALAMEFGPKGIRVNAVAPGRINAPERFERWRNEIAADGGKAQTVEDIQRDWGHRIRLPNHRWGSVEEVARLAVFAASPACYFMTGAVLVLDGGETRD